MWFTVCAAISALFALLLASRGLYGACAGFAFVTLVFVVCRYIQERKSASRSNQTPPTGCKQPYPQNNLNLNLRGSNIPVPPSAPLYRNSGQYPGLPSQSSIPSVSPPSPALRQPEAVPKPVYNSERHHVAGVSYRQSEIESLIYGDNPLYSFSKQELIDDFHENEYIYQDDFRPSKVELLEEPDNPHDPNAIKVVVDGVHIGYIKKGSCSHVKKLLHSGKIVDIDIEIQGGKYKRVCSEYDYEKGEDVYEIECGTSDYYATVEIRYLNS